MKNQTEILKRLNLPATKERQQHAATLINLFKFVETMPEKKTVEVTDVEMYFGRKIDKWVTIEGEKMQGRKITIKCEIEANVTGCYSFTVPLPLYDYFAVKIGLQEETQTKTLIKTYNLETDVSKHLKKAAKYLGKDDLRPAMSYVLLGFFNNYLKIVGTDAHKLYVSKPIETDFPGNKQILIKGAFNQVKTATSISIDEDCNIAIDGVVFEKGSSEMKYPDYQRVLPEYDQFIEFENKPLQNAVKQAVIYANKYTHAVSLYMNGLIDVSGCDVDWETESSTKVPYKQKTFDDCTVGFNGKFLLEALKDCEPTVKMYHDTYPSHAALFEIQDAKILLMPVELNQY